jgi:NAD-dependent deacetylase
MFTSMEAGLPSIDDHGLRTAAERVARARRLLVLTGAGVSAESGVPTFRGPQGLWRDFRPEELATPEAFERDPALVWAWYDSRRQAVARVAPNAAHHALAALEARASEFLLSTQNVDGLHTVAGSRRVVELHGTLWRLRCVACRAESEDRRTPLPTLPPRCACGGLLRPGVVWFGEGLPQDALYQSFAAAKTAEVVLVVGTSSVVYPAAALPEAARAAGAFVIEINPEATPLTPLASLSLRGLAAAIVPAIVGGAAA